MIEARGLTKRFDGHGLALEDVNFTVGPGEIYCLLGSVGSGKTTAISLFWSGERPTRGQVLVGAIDATLRPMAAKRMMTVIASTRWLHPTLTVRGNVEFFVRMAGSRSQALRRSVEHAMRQMGVRERDFDRPLHQCGRDIWPLVWLSVACARDTPAVLIDDPTTGLSPRAADAVHDALLQLRDLGKAVLVATSDVALATTVADRVSLLKAGRQVAERSRAQLLGQSLVQFHIDY